MLRILLQMRTYLRYVPTDLKHSDGPGRQQAIEWHAAPPQTKGRPSRARAWSKESRSRKTLRLQSRQPSPRSTASPA